MPPRSISFFCLVFLMLAGLIRPQCGRANQSVDDSIYAGLLKKYVFQGRVDYAGFKSDETKLDQYLQLLAQVDTKTLSRNEQFAFYINAYNAWTIKLILSGYPGIKSIKDLGGIFQSPWKIELVRIDGDILSLDDVEHNILRPRFKDPRVHFAVNCASKSCPPLRSEPYRGEILNQQLSDATRSFLNDPANYHFVGNDFFVSRIFKWYSEDFNGDILGFYRQYAQGDLKSRLEAAGHKIQIKYMDYDWSLNGS